MIQAVIWDVDGTLIDSEPLHLEALLAVCDRHRVDISDLSDDHFIGVNLFGVWNALRERFPSTLTVQSWVGELNNIYAAGVAKLVPIPDSLMVVRLGHIKDTVRKSNEGLALGLYLGPDRVFVRLHF